MRPEVVAFRELETLVRHLGEQLAGFRRRALSAETRVRELEQILAGMHGKLDELREQAETMQQSRDAALLEARSLETQLASLRRDQASAPAASPDAVPTGFSPVAGSGAPLIVTGSNDDASTLREENALLRGRLAEARERTSRLGERVRFLRQQVSLGVER